jgi:hypothetical protein
MNSGAVVTIESTKEKLAFEDPLVSAISFRPYGHRIFTAKTIKTEWLMPTRT